MVVVLPSLLIVSVVALSAYAWVEYSLTDRPTGRTRLVRNGMEYEIEAECKWFFGFFRCWRKLSRWKPIAGSGSYSDELTPKPYDSSSSLTVYKVVSFETEEKAEETAIEWRTQNILKEKKHEHDGPKEELTAPLK